MSWNGFEQNWNGDKEKYMIINRNGDKVGGVYTLGLSEITLLALNYLRWWPLHGVSIRVNSQFTYVFVPSN